MCGIAGIIDLNSNHSIDPNKIVRMCDVMEHRGPDGEGFLFSSENQNYTKELKTERPNAKIDYQNSNRNVCLGHRRLSIIDLSSDAAQPMSNVSNNLWIVFNGEIYNHREIRKELEQNGFKFKTDHSDTEVILNAYSAWGIDSVRRLRGMFSFVLWDKNNDFFWFVRDRLGIKPLFYSVHNGLLYFASEIKAILAVSDIKREINNVALFDYLSFTSTAPPDTMFSGINKIAAGHMLKIVKGEVSNQIKYWDALNSNIFVQDSEKQIIENIYTGLKESVNIRREADVNYGVLLSGGIDSSANTALLSSMINSPAKSFTVGFKNNNEGYTNEFEYARIIADQYKTEHHEIELDENDFLDFFPAMIYHQDEPIADTANIPIYYVSKLAKQNDVTVLIGGEGSDELLIGYELWRFASEFDEFFKKYDSKILINFAKVLLGLPYLKNKRTFYSGWLENLSTGQQIFRGGNEVRSESDKNSIISNNYCQSLNGYNSNKTINDYFARYNSSGRKGLLDWASYLDLNYRLPELLLARLDRMTMAASVEGRVPFLDHKFVEMCMSIDPKLKLKNKTDKYLLKQAVKDILPPEIIYRRKDGFTIPLKQLFQNDFENYSTEVIREFNKATNLFDEKYINTIFAQNLSSDKWTMLNLAAWWKKFIC
ncbi:MAG: asparagine synthase (glutamine-hydrolyzing) [Melioribacteraceae bacterium]|nr:asparagine synthase (glutamine-hydrolyzing) [Melioribacteraceae bacterium]MCF8262869.1 asparagine synthase (glutamine-hydrolyzing) [Melioribacteraceae bacterium]MCF8430903.1 asparagine synthase (glutamine-hydrolyzing) [Melioribacteraceae bacterium]